MYKYPSKQLGMSDFGMPMGMELDPGNRWVIKAKIIPWEDIEQRYAELFASDRGNVAKPLRLALGALIIQTERKISDEEVVLQIQETPCLQYFCGLPQYKEEAPFEASSMVNFRKRLDSEILGQINEMIIAKAQESEIESIEDDQEGTLIVDATCAPQNIRYPQDTSLLNEARENLEAMIDELHKPTDGVKPRTYRRNARKEYLKIAKNKKKNKKQVRVAVGKQLRYIRRDLGIVENYLEKGEKLRKWQKERLTAIYTLYDQQLYMYEHRVQRVDNRIVSLNQPWVRPIVRGKAKSKCEFGAKLDVSVADGFSRLEETSFNAYNEAENLTEIIERYKVRTGKYPKRVLVDKIYRNRENLNYCKEKNIELLGKPLGRPGKDQVSDKKRQHQDEIDRIEVERKFSHAKGSFGLSLIRCKLKETSETAISLSIITLNIAYIQRISFALIQEALIGVIILVKRIVLSPNLVIIQ